MISIFMRSFLETIFTFIEMILDNLNNKQIKKRIRFALFFLRLIL
jgi:hypothetical protein